jgi:hypothetical protein
MTGKLFIDTGQIVHAQCGELTGEEAFNRLLAMSGGQFNLKPFTEPPARSLSGQWEFLLMEAARQSDEDKETKAALTAGAGEKFREEVERLNSGAASADASPSPSGIAAALEAPAGPAPHLESPGVWPAGVASRPKVDEVLVCSAQGEVLYEWQCAHTDLWVNFFEFVSQQGRRLAQALPVGEFNRLEIQSGGVRAVVIIANGRGVLVKTRREAVSA